jgi:hypothetical protein
LGTAQTMGRAIWPSSLEPVGMITAMSRAEGTGARVSRWGDRRRRPSVARVQYCSWGLAQGQNAIGTHSLAPIGTVTGELENRLHPGRNGALHLILCQ